MNLQPMVEQRFEGPLETSTFPERLTARVVTPGAKPRVHGYDVEGDLARHYRFTDLFMLYLTRELPSPQVAQAVDVALMFLSPVAVTHASVHAAVLGRLCGGPPRSLFGVAAVGLAEQAHFELSGVTELLKWFGHQRAPFPDAHRATTPDERSRVQRLLQALPEGYHVPAMDHGPTFLALVLAVFHDAGLRRLEQFEAAFAFARLPSALAEALAERPTNFGQYPIHLPPMEYREPDAQP